MLGWLVVFALISAFISNPFQSEPSAGASPNYFHVMFLHGLLVGVVGLGALVTCHVLVPGSRHVRVWITVGVLVATVPVAIGGLFDRRVPGDEGPLWTQITGFFALDEIFLVLLIGMVVEWWRRAAGSRTLPFLAGLVATASMLIAAVMGHLAGWILEFGNTPGWVDRYARFIGESRGDLTNNLIGSHSHEMVVALMALIVALAARQFGVASMEGWPRRLAQLGLLSIMGGTVAMTGVYVTAGFTTWAPPAWFTSGKGGVNGIASDDVVTGVFVMGGGLLVLCAFALVAAGKLASLRRQPVRVAALWSWALSFGTVVVAGYAIELDTSHFGAGDPKAPGASADAVYTWLHQDVGLFLLPLLTLTMLVVERFLAPRLARNIGLAIIGGATALFIGVVTWVFIDTALHGPGYILSTIGLSIIGSALLATLWWGALKPLLAHRAALRPTTAAGT